MALAAGLASYSFGLPLTVRSAFYPVLGNYCWGWIGDFIDGWSIVMTVGELKVMSLLESSLIVSKQISCPLSWSLHISRPWNNAAKHR